MAPTASSSIIHLTTAAQPHIDNPGHSGLLPALIKAQKQNGYISKPVAAEIARVLQVPLAEVYGVIEFYALLYKEPTATRVIRICGDPACAIAGGHAALEAVCASLGVSPNTATADGGFMVERSPCLGLCDQAPAAMVNDMALGCIPVAVPAAIIAAKSLAKPAVVGGSLRHLTRRCGTGATPSLAAYTTDGGYSALTKAVQQLTPAAVIAELKSSGLVGRGGAAFPTGVKWESAANASGAEKYIVCNADESEPGTFKDRILMEDDPHAVLEGMALAGYACGAQRGYLYVRAEYPHAQQRLATAIAEAAAGGYLGNNLLGSKFCFDIELRSGAGAYICGEETALFESIEGKRGFPRVKPPFPTTAGLFGKPTVVNNVETLCNVPLIIGAGAAAYRMHGTEKSPGSKLFCLSGDVARPGLYEVPFGVTLRTILDEMAGGVSGGTLQAVLFGGAAGAFATAAHLDVPMTFEDLRKADLPLGSGVVMVFNHTRNLRSVLEGLAHFFAEESCGKCYPCQLGTVRQHEILGRIAAGHARAGDKELLADVGWTMLDASLCGLGQTAATATLSAIKLWPELFAPNGQAQTARTS